MRKETIHPNQEDMQAMYVAIFYHRKNLNNYIPKEELLSDAYIGLINALYSYSIDKCKDKKKYLIQNIKYHLINTYRKETKSRNKNKINVSSLNINIDDENRTEYIDIIESSQKSQEDIVYEKEVMDIVEKSFGKIEKIRKYDWVGDDLYVILMLRMENYNFKDIAYLFDISESKISRVYHDKVVPILQEIRAGL